ncbi:MAG: uridine kinase, partial [bacterium]
MTFVIGIAGGTGSGKTTVAHEIISAFGPLEITSLELDNYYRDLSHLPLNKRTTTNFDHPDSLEIELLVDNILDLKAGKSIHQPLYDFVTHTRKKTTHLLKPTPIIVLEGILTFCYPKLLPLFDMKIFVDTEADIRFIRRLERDLEERGRSLQSIISQYQKTVRPMHLEFIEPSKHCADIIIPEGRNNV